MKSCKNCLYLTYKIELNFTECVCYACGSSGYQTGDMFYFPYDHQNLYVDNYVEILAVSSSKQGAERHNVQIHRNKAKVGPRFHMSAPYIWQTVTYIMYILF